MFRIVFFMMVFMVSGCSGVAKRPANLPHGMTLEDGDYLYRGRAKVDLNNVERVRQKLLAQYRHWKGIRYAYGGLSRNGIDCSGLVQIAYLNGLGIELPRTTELQVALGREIDLDELRPGDLLFFKTGFYDRHVGIYMGGGNFFHASQSKGVTISNLNNDYWADNFWLAKRVY